VFIHDNFYAFEHKSSFTEQQTRSIISWPSLARDVDAWPARPRRSKVTRSNVLSSCTEICGKVSSARPQQFNCLHRRYANPCFFAPSIFYTLSICGKRHVYTVNVMWIQCYMYNAHTAIRAILIWHMYMCTYRCTVHVYVHYMHRYQYMYIYAPCSCLLSYIAWFPMSGDSTYVVSWKFKLTYQKKNADASTDVFWSCYFMPDTCTVHVQICMYVHVHVHVYGWFLQFHIECLHLTTLQKFLAYLSCT